MPSETIVAVYDTSLAAEEAIAGLLEHGVPEKAIQHFGQSGSDVAAGGMSEPSTAFGSATGTTERSTTGSGGGIWSWLSGDRAATARHSDEYDRSIGDGRNVVTVVIEQAMAASVLDVLERHSPINLEEHGIDGAVDAVPPTAPSMPPTAGSRATAGTVGDGEKTISLAEESLDVGRRTVERGTTRVRRYVVERPVEEQIRLRDEHVSVFRRPVTGRGTTLAPDAFSEKIIEMNETSEEAVVAKKAFVAEEVVVRKAVDEHVETVRDTVRKEEVEITGPDGKTMAAATDAKTAV